MSDEEHGDHLEHYGVKGMRWGVRRRRGSSGRVQSVKKPSVDARTTRELRKRPPHTLTNMQLKKVNERMQLEQKFSQMNPTKKARGQAKLKAVIAAGTTGITLYNMANSPAGKAAMATGRKAMSSRVAGRRAPTEYTALLRKI